jgi:hypothetical protein
MAERKSGQRRMPFQIKQRTGHRNTSYYLSVPLHLATQIPLGTQFVPELVQEGLLYRRVDEVPPPKVWTKRGGS